MVVVLPAPFGPSRPKISPGADLEVQVVDRGEVAVALGQAARPDPDRARAASRRAAARRRARRPVGGPAVASARCAGLALIVGRRSGRRRTGRPGSAR